MSNFMPAGSWQRDAKSGTDRALESCGAGPAEAWAVPGSRVKSYAEVLQSTTQQCEFAGGTPVGPAGPSPAGRSQGCHTLVSIQMQQMSI